MANVATLAQTDDQYWRSSRSRLQRSSADLKLILGRERGPDVTSLTESSCRLLESTRPFSKLHYNKMPFTQSRPSKEGPAGKKTATTARVHWRLPEWLDALSHLETNDKKMQKRALRQLTAGPPRAPKRDRRGSQEGSRSRPSHGYDTLAFLGDMSLSDVLMESLNDNNHQESSHNVASKTYTGYTSLSSFSTEATRSRAAADAAAAAADETGMPEVKGFSKGHVTFRNVDSLDEGSSYTPAKPNKLRMGGLAALFVSQAAIFRARSRDPVVSDPKSFLDCGYLRLKPQTVLDLEEMCRKRGIEPRPHRHMTSEQLVEYCDELRRRPMTSDEDNDKEEKVLNIWSRDR